MSLYSEEYHINWASFHCMEAKNILFLQTRIARRTESFLTGSLGCEGLFQVCRLAIVHWFQLKAPLENGPAAWRTFKGLGGAAGKSRGDQQ